MTYLLAQMGLCLLLALLAGWYIGWTWRGFRDKDQLDDLRHTLRATEEVKDRELAEAQRRADALEAKVETLERRSERMADEIAERPGPRLLPVLEPAAEPVSSAPASQEIGSEELAGAEADRQESEAPEAGASDEREEDRLRDAKKALAAKNAAMLELEAELASLRSGAERRADRIAKLESQLVELEPLEERLEAITAERDRLRSELEGAREGTEEHGSKLDELVENVSELEEAIQERDRRINALRQRYQDTAARLEVAEADQQALRKRHADNLRGARGEADDSDLDERLRAAERDLTEAREALQRQVERNRKQEAVHQQVVANLRNELRAARATPSPAQTPPEQDGRVRQLVADRDAHIVALRRKVQELEAGGRSKQPRARDDLKKIRGIGPKLEELLNSLGVTRFAQIAGWSDDDVERYGEKLPAFRQRILWDDWVENARRQHILRYGDPPGDPGQGS